MVDDAALPPLRLAAPASLANESGRALYAQAERALGGGPPRPLVVDLTATRSIDSLGCAWLARMVRLGRQQGGTVALEGATGAVARYLDLVDPAGLAEAPPPPPRRENVFARVGHKFFAVVAEAREALSLLVGTIYWTAIGPFEGRGFRWRGLIDELDRMGAQALFIVVLTNYLLGLIIAILSGVQLRAFGAEIFVADLVVIAFTRELAAVMTAVIISARSGAAIAAELATMKVSEEIDALRSLGLDPIKFLVAPKVAAILVAMPCLTLIGMVAGTLGGFHLGVLGLGFSSDQWMTQTLGAATLKDVSLGLQKAVVFGLIIVLIGCHNGLRVSGGARGVGMATTRAVVMDVFCIILADLIFGLPEFLR